MKSEPYIFHCSKCKFAHGGECPPSEIVISDRQKKIKEMLDYIDEQMQKATGKAVWKIPIYYMDNI
jgi:hypothetical protein